MDRRIGPHHADGLAAEAPVEDRPESLGQGGLEHQPFIRVHRPLHHGLPQAIGAGEQHRIPEARLGVDAEHHPGAGPVGQHHALYPDREGHLKVIEAVDLAVGEGAIGEQGGVAAAAGLQQGRLPFDVQEGVLLAGEAGLGQILGRSAGAHRHGRRAELAVGLQDLRLQRGRKRRRQQPAAGGGSRQLQGLQVAGIELGQEGGQALLKPVVAQQQPVGRRRGGEAPGHPHPGRPEFADHLAQGGVLAPHTGQGSQIHRLKRQHQCRCVPGSGLRSGWGRSGIARPRRGLASLSIHGRTDR